jgi:hypothetical protein
MNTCKHCGALEMVNGDPYNRPLPLLNPTRAEVVNYHRRGECVTVDPPGINYNNPANRGR